MEKHVETPKNKVLLLIDWENVFSCLFNDFGPDRLNLDYRFKKLMEWIKAEIGELFGDHGFIFAPSHFTAKKSRYDARIRAPEAGRRDRKVEHIRGQNAEARNDTMVCENDPALQVD